MKTKITFLLVSLMLTATAQWSVLTTGTYSNLVLEDIHVSPSGDTLIAVGTDLGAGFVGHTLKSYDGGQSWDTTQYDPGYLFKGISFADDKTGVIAALGSAGCALRTTDGGHSWTWNWCDLTHSGVYDVKFVNKTTGYFAGYGDAQFTDGAVFRTTDAGQSWNYISGSVSGRPFDFIKVASSQVLYTGSFLFFNEHLNRSTDGGYSWDTVDMRATGCNDVHFHNATTGILLGRDGIYRTTDSAGSWSKVGDFPSYPNLNFASVDFMDTTYGWAVGSDPSSTGHFFHTSDGGRSWQRQPYTVSNANFVKVRAFGNRAYAVTSRGTVLVSPEINVGFREFIENLVEVSPNPASEVVKVNCRGLVPDLKEVKITDLQGRPHKVNSSRHGDELDVEVNSLPNGMYLLHLSLEDGEVVSKKLMINR